MKAQEALERARVRSASGDLQGARETLLNLLRAAPRHLEGRLLLGDLLLRLGSEREARNHFEVALAIDPLNTAALRGAAEAYQRTGEADRAERLRVLMDALAMPEPSLATNGDKELLLAQAESLWASGRHAEAAALLAKIDLPGARSELILADLAIRKGDERQAAARLHAARGLDPSLLVARELYAPHGLYTEYLESELEIEAGVGEDVPIPVRPVEPLQHWMEPASSIPSSALQSNWVATPTRLEDADPLEKQIELIVTSRGRLLDHYGEGFQEIEERLNQLAEAIPASSALEAALVYVDDEMSLRPWGVNPIEPGDAGQVRALIESIEEKLRREGMRVGYLLLVGGDEIVPFFRLPNAAEDQDEAVLSDAPYAAQGTNYLLADRAVGRIPTSQRDPRLLIEILERTAEAHRTAKKKKGLLGIFDRSQRSLGLSAQIWEEAARAVFAPLGGGKAFQISPPATDQDFLERHSRLPLFAYFNLHGVRGGPYWYGHQRQPSDGETLFPIALTPHNLTWLEAPAGVVFSEACYGAEIVDRSPQDSIALSFLGTGTRALVGSTAMAYGSLNTPLSGADLLARFFWQGLLEGYPVGEALRRAKLGLIEEMGRRQGYLDGEDQKTLLSFVLYGDPSLPSPAPSGAGRKRAAWQMDDLVCPAVVCARANGDAPSASYAEVLEQVGAYIADFVPKLAAGVTKVSALKFCTGDCGCQPCPLRGSPVRASPQESRWVFTASAREPLPESGELPQVVRLTTDSRGKILKIAFSK